MRLLATWVTHLMVADLLLQQFPDLNRRGFSVGNIAPDCNIENEDWTAFTPSREVTHWMRGPRKVMSDCKAFYDHFFTHHLPVPAVERDAFLLGYTAHLITDVHFQRFLRDEQRVQNMWSRIRANKALAEKSKGMPETFDAMKKLLPKAWRLQELATIEAAYLRQHPTSAYLTEIVTLQDFPDYLDFLPHGCVPRKIAVMGEVPRENPSCQLVTVTAEEIADFVQNASDFCATEWRTRNT